MLLYLLVGDKSTSEYDLQHWMNIYRYDIIFVIFRIEYSI